MTHADSCSRGCCTAHRKFRCWLCSGWYHSSIKKRKERVKITSKESNQVVYSSEDLRLKYEQMTALAEVECTLTARMAGGQPAGPEGVALFVKHYLKLEGGQAEEAVARILREEIGERDATPESGEIKEKLSYAINVIRRDEFGPWVGSWMVKATLKNAATGLAYFTSLRGSKRDVAEMGEVTATGPSLLLQGSQAGGWNSGDQGRIHLVDVEGKPAKTVFERIPGSVTSPQGRKSIVTDVECAEPGAKMCFAFRFAPGKLKADHVANLFAAAQNIGLGSAKAFDRGKFRVDRLVVTGA